MGKIRKYQRSIHHELEEKVFRRCFDVLGDHACPVCFGLTCETVEKKCKNIANLKAMSDEEIRKIYEGQHNKSIVVLS